MLANGSIISAKDLEYAHFRISVHTAETGKKASMMDKERTLGPMVKHIVVNGEKV